MSTRERGNESETAQGENDAVEQQSPQQSVTPYIYGSSHNNQRHGSRNVHPKIDLRKSDGEGGRNEKIIPREGHGSAELTVGIVEYLGWSLNVTSKRWYILR